MKAGRRRKGEAGGGGRKEAKPRKEGREGRKRGSRETEKQCGGWTGKHPWWSLIFCTDIPRVQDEALPRP